MQLDIPQYIHQSKGRSAWCAVYLKVRIIILIHRSELCVVYSRVRSNKGHEIARINQENMDVAINNTTVCHLIWVRMVHTVAISATAERFM